MPGAVDLHARQLIFVIFRFYPLALGRAPGGGFGKEIPTGAIDDLPAVRRDGKRRHRPYWMVWPAIYSSRLGDLPQSRAIRRHGVEIRSAGREDASAVRSPLDRICEMPWPVVPSAAGSTGRGPKLRISLYPLCRRRLSGRRGRRALRIRGRGSNRSGSWIGARGLWRTVSKRRAAVRRVRSAAG